MTDQQRATRAGWATFVLAVGATLGLIGQEIVSLTDWREALSPPFVGAGLIHVATVIASFVGGRASVRSGRA